MGATGATGPKGDPGATQPAPPPAAVAREVRFDAPAETSAGARTVLDMPGLRLSAACARTGGDVALDLHVTVPESTTLQSTFSLDTGADPANPPQPGDPGLLTGNGQSTLAAGTDNDLGGPGTQGGTGYFRGLAHAILVSASRTITLELFELVDAGTGRCQIGGTALPAT
jgi:hypothetical protein